MDRTLTMQRIDILTTNIIKLVCENIREPNPIYNPSKEEVEGLDKAERIKAISYMVKVCRSKYKTEDIFGILFNRFISVLEAYNKNEIKTYLFVSDTVWQPNTKIVSYYGLWKRKLFSEQWLKEKLKPKETVIESKYGLRFCGVIEVSLLEINNAISLALNNAGVFLYISSNSLQQESEKVIEYYKSCYSKDMGYEIEIPNLIKISEVMARQGNLILRPTNDDSDTMISLDIFSFRSNEIFDRLWSANL